MARGHKTGGRKTGTPNRATAQLRDLAQQHTEAAIARLVHLLENSQSEAVQVAAARELLDRAHGRPAQSVMVDDGSHQTVEEALSEILAEIGAGMNGIPSEQQRNRTEHLQ